MRTGKLAGLNAMDLHKLCVGLSVGESSKAIGISRQRLNQWMATNGLSFKIGIVDVVETEERRKKMSMIINIDEIIKNTGTDGTDETDETDETVDLFDI